METIAKVCVSCRKIDQGHGEWATLAGHPIGKTKKSICPKCCRNRFPQFYDDLGPPEKEKKGVSAILTSISKIMRA